MLFDPLFSEVPQQRGFRDYVPDATDLAGNHRVGGGGAGPGRPQREVSALPPVICDPLW